MASKEYQKIFGIHNLCDMISPVKFNSKEYWENYYKRGVAPSDPSLFAQHIGANYLNPGGRLVELGCGNGRDAHYFATLGFNVIAIDQCESEISELIKTNGTYDNLHFQSADFTTLDDSDQKFDLVYSRFTLHSVTEQQQYDTLMWAHNNLIANGLLCIETRGQKNELYKLGEPVDGEIDAYMYDGHYRRFTEFDTFVNLVTGIGFTAIEATENTGFAPFKDTDYHFIRLIASKQ